MTIADSNSYPRTVISDQYVDRGKLRNLLDTLHRSDDGNPNYNIKVGGTRTSTFRNAHLMVVEGKQMDNQRACPALKSKNPFDDAILRILTCLVGPNSRIEAMSSLFLVLLSEKLGASLATVTTNAGSALSLRAKLNS
jgi:hypothetical protein